ncbi:MAG: hypothetical protein ACI89U_002623, partial [Gammaproteobacteria bacterium]
ASADKNRTQEATNAAMMTAVIIRCLSKVISPPL